MSENPYEPPTAELIAVGVKSADWRDVRAVAQYQKGLLICILINLILLVGRIALPPDFDSLLGVVAIVAGLVGAVFVALLSVKVYRTTLGILFGLFAMVPFFGLIVLLTVNGKATRILRANGLRVGLLGVNLNEIDRLAE